MKWTRYFSIRFLAVLYTSLVYLAVAKAEVMTPLLASKLSSDVYSIEELARQGDYFQAIVLYFGKDELDSIAEKLAAARSAWALGLVDVARELWDEVFVQRGFQGVERSRAVLARAIMELQESNFETARAFAENAARNMEASDLRAQLWLVIAEALKEQGAISLAEGYYKRALEEGSKETTNEATYLLGECQFKLGLVNESRYTFAGLETTSLYTSEALRRLAAIDLEQRNYEGVLTWIEEGRESFPSEFSTGWTTYAMVSALLELGRLESAAAEVRRFRVKHTEKNTWFALAQAALEAAYAKRLHPELREESQARVEAGATAQKKRGRR